MTLPLRPARESDRGPVCSVDRAAFATLEEATWGPVSNEALARRRADWSPERWQVLEQRGEVVAIVRARQEPDHDYLGLIAVSPSHQGRGIGASLLRTLMDRAAKRGVPLWLSVYRTNPARHVYVHLGFGWKERDPLRLWMAWPRDTAQPPPSGPKGIPDDWVAPPLDLPVSSRLPPTPRGPTP